MDPLTHAAFSWTLSRAGCNRISPRATPVLIVAGLIADLDLCSFFGGPEAYLRWNHALTHSILGATVLTFAVAGIFWASGSRADGNAIPFRVALLLSAIGMAGHIVLDICTTDGVRLLWPFRQSSIAWDLLGSIDPWILLILLAGVALPSLVRMVGDEIGARRKGPAPIRGAVIALVLVAAYIAVRADYHDRAVNSLMSHDYHGAVPLLAGAFPEGSLPFDWRGVVSTENTIEVVDVPVGPGGDFNALRAEEQFKPGSSPALTAAQEARVTRLFLAGARFPLATMEHTDTGYTFIARDLRFEEDSRNPANVEVEVTLDFEARATSQKLHWTTSPLPWL